MRCLQVAYDPQQRPYYYNATTGVSQWEQPPGTIMCGYCENKFARKRCTACDDDTFCYDCYFKDHAKGKKKEHDALDFPGGLSNVETKMCCECDTSAASRNCHQCDEPYCTSCFEYCHSKGKRALHTFDEIDISTGITLCAACDVAEATRMCDNCEDPYCALCFEDNHQKGRRALHTSTPIAPKKKVRWEL